MDEDVAVAGDSGAAGDRIAGAGAHQALPRSVRDLCWFDRHDGPEVLVAGDVVVYLVGLEVPARDPQDLSSTSTAVNAVTSA